ncbi:MAG TPA: hypothetical protein VFQ51_12855 [Vicinamibacteria bacterium]|nr:hypothetical protein [Vicinamibacteria bacterium]
MTQFLGLLEWRDGSEATVLCAFIVSSSVTRSRLFPKGPGGWL